MSDQGYLSPQLEQLAGKNRKLNLLVTLKGNTSAASIAGFTDANVGAQVWLASASLTAPTDATFTGLVSTTAPAVIGIYITDPQARVFKGATVPVSSIRSPSMTAGVVTATGLTSAIAGKTGIASLTNGNVAFTISCTTLDLDAQTSDHTFAVDVEYDVA